MTGCDESPCWNSRSCDRCKLRVARAEIDRLRDALKEACDEYDYAATYKGEFLRHKHCDDETLKRLRSLLSNGEGEGT